MSPSQGFSKLTVSYYADKARNIRQIVLVVLILVMITNVYYDLYYCPWLVLLGNIHIGTNDAQGVKFSGELSRLYSKEMLAIHVSFHALFSVVRTLSGPSFHFLFENVNFPLGH